MRRLKKLFSAAMFVWSTLPLIMRTAEMLKKTAKPAPHAHKKTKKKTTTKKAAH